MSNTQVSKAESSAYMKAVVAEIEAQVARIEKRVAERPGRQAHLEEITKGILELHNRVVDVEIEQGLRTARPVRKRNASLAEQLREIVDERTVRKGGNNGSTISWRNML